MRNTFFLVCALILGVTTGCQDEVVGVESDSSAATAVQSTAALSKVGFGQIWADGELFRTVAPPATFKPDSGPFDRLFHGDFADGIGAISESKPGDQDWNGGRWEIWDPVGDLGDKYDDADSFEDLDINDFYNTGVYVECPLTPQRGRGHD